MDLWKKSCIDRAKNSHLRPSWSSLMSWRHRCQAIRASSSFYRHSKLKPKNRWRRSNKTRKTEMVNNSTRATIRIGTQIQKKDTVVPSPLWTSRAWSTASSEYWKPLEYNLTILNGKMAIMKRTHLPQPLTQTRTICKGIKRACSTERAYCRSSWRWSSK